MGTGPQLGTLGQVRPCRTLMAPGKGGAPWGAWERRQKEQPGREGEWGNTDFFFSVPEITTIAEAQSGAGGKALLCSNPAEKEK